MKTNLQPGTYLCQVQGFRHCDFMVLRHDNDGWWQHTSTFLPHEITNEGWVALSQHLKVTQVYKLLKLDTTP